MTQNTLLAVVLVAFVVQTLGHSYVTKPITRSNQKESNTGCRGPNCFGPCDRSLASTTRSPIAIQRGASISVQWPRNNHAGGFIRLAWAPTAQSDSHASFDAGVQQIVCHEIGGCRPDSASEPNGGDSGPADGSSRACTVNITVPGHLPNGAYTLQWAWFGGAFALGDYYSCVDYLITGGPSSSQAAAVFIGGDYTYPGQQKCKYFNTDRLHRCTQEPCENPVFALNQERSGAPFGISAVSAVATTGVATTSKVTSGVIPVASPITSGATVVASPITSGVRPATTGAQVQSLTTGAVQSSGGNTCAGAHTLSPSQAVISDMNVWPNNFQATIQITVSESVLRNWHLQVVYPNGMTNAHVTAVYNSGKLQCESSSPQPHSLIEPAGSWANNVPQGTVLMVEIQATNVGSLSASYITQNLQLKVYSA